MPVPTVTVTAAVLFAGIRSNAPCTEQKLPAPVSATLSVDRSLGAAAMVVNRQVLVSVIENAPPGAVIAPLSTFT